MHVAQVRIFVLIYHEVSFALPNGSGHAMRVFRGTHRNVTVLRAPQRKLKNRVRALKPPRHGALHVCLLLQSG